MKIQQLFLIAALLGAIVFAIFFSNNYLVVKSEMQLSGQNEGIWKLNKNTGELQYCRFNYSADFLTCVKETSNSK